MELTPDLKKIARLRLKDLCKVYSREPQIGLVLGAGVTCGSGVPMYKDMVLELCLSMGLRPEALPGLKFLRKIYSKELDFDSLQVAPEEIALFLKINFDKNQVTENDLVKKLKEICYGDTGALTHKMVDGHIYEQNATLNSVICFCAAKPGSKLVEIPEGQIGVDSKVKRQKV